MGTENSWPFDHLKHLSSCVSMHIAWSYSDGIVFQGLKFKKHQMYSAKTLENCNAILNTKWPQQRDLLSLYQVQASIDIGALRN